MSETSNGKGWTGFLEMVDGILVDAPRSELGELSSEENYSQSMSGHGQHTLSSGSASIMMEPFASRTGRSSGLHQAYFLCALSFLGLGMPFPPRPEKRQVERLWPSWPQFEHTMLGGRGRDSRVKRRRVCRS